MIYEKTNIQGIYLIHLEKNEDPRGFFARTFDRDEFLSHGLGFEIVQISLSYNKQRGTVRGMHVQLPPHEEEKLVQCVRGEIVDIVLDLRKDSPTYKQHLSITLNEQNNDLIYIPNGVAHGFQTQRDNTVIQYHMSTVYVPESSSGMRWNDPAFNIKWPLPITIISDRDNSYDSYR